MKKLFVLVLVGLIPTALFAEGTLDTDTVLLQTKSVLDQYANRIKSLEAEMRKFRWENGDLKVGDPVYAPGHYLHGDSSSYLIDPRGKILQIKRDDVLVELNPWYMIPRNRWFKMGELELWEDGE